MCGDRIQKYLLWGWGKERLEKDAGSFSGHVDWSDAYSFICQTRCPFLCQPGWAIVPRYLVNIILDVSVKVFWR